MRYDTDWIANQPGASAGLWTHTPVDWAADLGYSKPSTWPTDAINGTPGPTTGTRPGQPVPPAVASAAPAAGAVTITWTTTFPSDSNVDIGLTTAYGFASVHKVESVTAHSVTVSGLTAGLTYHYRVSSSGGGYTMLGADSTFVAA